jgi:cell division protein FtsB
MNVSKLTFIALAVIFFYIQYFIWLADDGYQSVSIEKQRLVTQGDGNKALSIRNEILKAEITSLREGDEAIEEIARSELGMIAPDETFFVVIK